MRAFQTLVRVLAAVAILAVLLPGGVALGQNEPEKAPASSPEPLSSPAGPEPGVCAPWHRCVAYGVLAMGVLYLLFLGAMYAYQRRGFDQIEHRMGNPDGVPLKKS